MTKCAICGKKIDHPVRRGRKAKLCSDACRVIYKKAWRRDYDAQPSVRGKKAARQMVAYRAAKSDQERKRIQRNRVRRERYMQAK